VRETEREERLIIREKDYHKEIEINIEIVEYMYIFYIVRELEARLLIWSV